MEARAGSHALLFAAILPLLRNRSHFALAVAVAPGAGLLTLGSELLLLRFMESIVGTGSLCFHAARLRAGSKYGGCRRSPAAYTLFAGQPVRQSQPARVLQV